MYFEHTSGLRLLLSGNFGLRPKFTLSERRSKIASLFG